MGATLAAKGAAEAAPTKTKNDLTLVSNINLVY
jgi:hypothetical protein